MIRLKGGQGGIGISCLIGTLSGCSWAHYESIVYVFTSMHGHVDRADTSVLMAMVHGLLLILLFLLPFCSFIFQDQVSLTLTPTFSKSLNTPPHTSL